MEPFKIAILGSDGSGKTTFRKFLKNKFKKQGKTVEEHIFGWKNFQNPILKIISKIYLKIKPERNKKQERLERFKERSFFFYLLYYLELWTRYLKVKKSKKNIVLMDRYFYEELMSMKGGKFWIFEKITPVPNLCIVLQTPLKEIIKRDHYASPKRFNTFYSKLKKLSQKRPIVFLNSSKSLNKMYLDIGKYLPK